jgi:hypothetical protein
VKDWKKKKKLQGKVVAKHAMRNIHYVTKHHAMKM